MKPWFALMIAFALALSGCSALPTATPVAKMAEATAQPAPIEQEPTTTAPAATATESAPHPPVVVSHAPASSEEVALDAVIAVTFDQAMAPDSVAMSLRPQAPGEIVWDDVATLRFVPSEPLAPDTRYTVEIASAASAEGLRMAALKRWTFRTVGELAVVNAFPAPGSLDVTTELPTLRLAFNRPVAPLAGLDSDAIPEPALDVVPAVQGSGEWTSTSIWTWTLDEPLRAGVVYSATLAGDLASAGGAEMSADYVWTFTTAMPRVEHVEPAPDELYAPADGAVAVVFGQAMDRRSAEDAFAVVDQGDASVAGRFSWDANMMRFQPDEPLESGSEYVARLSDDAQTAAGGVTLAKPTRWQFRVAPLPEVSYLSPADGAEDVQQSDGIALGFTSPISRATLFDGLTITPTTRVYPYWMDQDTIVELNGWLRSSTRYTVTVGEGVLGRDGAPLQDEAVFSFTTGPAEPMLSLDVPGRVGTYNAYAEPELGMLVRNLPEVELSLYELSRDDLLSLEGRDSWKRWELFRPEADDRIRRWTLPIDGEVDETVLLTTTLSAEGDLAPGYYLVSAEALGLKEARRHLLVVSPINLTLKAGQTSMLVWANDLSTGQPVADLPLTLYDANGRPNAALVTDDDGVATAPMPDQDRWEPLMVLAGDATPVGEGAPVAAVARNWMDGIEPYAFGFSVAYGSDEHLGYLYSDRAIYRPGQTVHLKGIVRRDLDARYALPDAETSVRVAVHDPEDRVILSREIALSDMGTFDVDVPLDDAAKLGRYWVDATLPDSGEYGKTFYHDFTVAEYRKPAFQLDVALGRDELLDGETLSTEATASYYSGGAVADAEVTWRVYSQPWVFDRYDGPGYWSWTDWDLDGMPRMWMPGQEQMSEGSGRTDAEGRFLVELPADLESKAQSQRWTVEVSVADKTYQQVSGRASAIVHRSQVYVGISSQQIVGRAGERQAVDLLALDPDGEPLSGQELTVVFLKHEWYSAKQQADDGEFYWTNAVRDTPLVTRTVSTDAEGRAESSFTPDEGGTYKVVVTSEDAEGRQARSALYLWVSGAGYINWGQQNNDRVELVPDKDSYSPGDVAQVLVPSPFDESVRALLTIERGDVLDHELITLASNSEVLELPITADHAPNVFMSLVMVKGMGDSTDESRLPACKLGYAALPVSIEEQVIDITIAPDQASYAPGDTARYAIATRDHTGAGVSAEVSLQLVDLAVEALTGAQAPRIVEHFYHERGLGVLTAATLALSVDRRTLEYPEEGKGGGGGPAEAGGSTRSEFADTAYWAPAVVTDDHGRAVVELTLPDNLTTWRMTAQGVTAETLVGAEQHDVVSSLPLQVRPIAPRFLLAGDRPVLGALIQNNTEVARDVTVALAADGVDVPTETRTVSVAAGASERVTWPAEALPDATSATLRYEATAGELSDAVEITLPIHPPSYADIVGTSGQVEEEITEVVLLPDGASQEQGGLAVTIEPSLTAAMAPGLDYLRMYPYLCVEQTVSRFLPNVALARALDEIEANHALDRTDLAIQVTQGVQRLTALQNLDGGWGWWGGQQSRPELTAYVLLGLAEARNAGYIVDENTLGAAVGYLYRWLDLEPGDTFRDRDLRATVLYALAEAGEGDLGRAVVLSEDDGAMSLYARAFLAMTLHALDTRNPERAEALVDRLLDEIILSASGAHWEESLDGVWAMNTDTRTTSLVLKALVAIAPDHSLAPQVVRWLVTAREAGRWSNTQENAWAILALTDYAVATGDLAPDYAWDVSLNGVELAAGRATPGEADATEVDVPSAELDPTAANLLRIARDDASAGNLYYTAFLSVYRDAEDVQPLDRGLFLRREYTITGADGETVSGASVGDTITCRLTLIAPHDTYYLLVEDPLPAGCEAIDTSLATSSMDVAGPMLRRSLDDAEVTEAQRLYWEWRYRWASHTELHDDRVALFADELPRGTYEYTYQMRCTTPGEFQALPAMAYGMYAPDVFGRSGGQSLYIAGAR